ncbi:MAG: hypothetical protein IJ459_07320 [Clostridia bacterium]|nr:hypothetical protein [Clostridia bacterium]
MKRFTALLLTLIMFSCSLVTLVSCKDTGGAGSGDNGNSANGGGSGGDEVGNGNDGDGSDSAEGDGNDNNHVCEVPELTLGDNGNWFLGGEDTGISCKLDITDTSAEIIESVGVNYCKVTITFSDGSQKNVVVELPKDDSSFKPTAIITNGYGGANGIICLMTDNDSGKFETLYLLDELYQKYGLVAGLGTVTKNLYTNSTYTVPIADKVAETQSFLDTGRWQIICHSMTHKTYGSGTGADFVIDEDRLYEEIVTSAALLRQLFPDERVLTYAMTGTQSAIGSSTDEYNFREAERKLIAEYYIGGRFSYVGPQSFDELEWNNLPYGLLSTRNLPTLLSNIDKAATEGKYYMVYNHYVIEDELIDTVSQSSWTTLSTAEALCERVAKYVADGSLWCAHFEDAVMYMRERQTASVLATYDNGVIRVLLTDKMDDEIYNHKLTVKITVPDSFAAVKIIQGDEVSYAEVISDGGTSYVLANLLPDGGIATLEPISPEDIPTNPDTGEGGTSDPSNPGGSNPTNPDNPDTGEGDTSDPSNPGGSNPTNPDNPDTGEGGTSDPSNPGGNNPTNPDNPDTGEGDTSDPSNPGGSNPTNPDNPDTGEGGTSNPSNPDTGIYTFDTLDGLLGTLISFDNQGNAASGIAVVEDGDEKVLAFSKTEGSNNPIIDLKAAEKESATTFTVEMDVKLERTSQAGEFYFTLSNSDSKSYAYRFYISIASSGALTLTDYNNCSGDSNVKTSASMGKKTGEWFRLKVEFIEGERESVKIITSVDGNVILESSNYYTVSGELLTAEDICKLRINPSAKLTGTVYIDDLSIG